MQSKLKTVTFTPRGQFYGCSAPGDMSGEYVPEDVAQELVAALVQANAQMELAGDAIEAGRYDEALLYVRSLSRQRSAAIAAATK